MLRSLQKIFLALAAAGAVSTTSAFSLMGPPTPWQTPDIGYMDPGGLALDDVGGVMNLFEAYRWDIKVIIYGFDPSFINYFGTRGVDEVNKAVAILNNLPPMSKTSRNLTEYPLDTRRVNYQAQSLSLIDLKSTALSALLSQVGLTSPERYVACLRSRVVVAGVTTNYTVLRRNFDPVTLLPTAYVNGQLYTYEIDEFPILGGGGGSGFVDAAEIPTDPAHAFNSVVSGVNAFIARSAVNGPVVFNNLNPGVFYTGLTRDDVGGLRFLYTKNRWATETLMNDVVLGQPSGGWAPAGSGNAGGAPVGAGLRPGIDKIYFKLMKNANGFGPFLAFTNSWNDTVIVTTNGATQKTNQRLAQPMVLPHIVFVAGDLGLTAEGTPLAFGQSDSSSWQDNAQLQGVQVGGPIWYGPGNIQVPPSSGAQQNGIGIFFSNIGYWNANSYPPTTVNEENAVIGWRWASFDGSTNAPYIYPNGGDVLQMQQQLTGGGN
ncbi:MAG: hypothetical protein U1F98_10085 [Verrucomicrobiota bacterium]